MGLIPKLLEYAERRDWRVKIGKGIVPKRKMTLEEADAFFDSLEIPEKYEKRGYQVQSIFDVINRERALLISPTSSGKSLIFYAIIEYLLRIGIRRVLLVVPNTALVTQIYKDFIGYDSESDDESFIPKRDCHLGYSGQEKITELGVTISTWQSFFSKKGKLSVPVEYFHSFQAVLGDEVHTFTGTSLADIMRNAVNARFRIGMTGTMHDHETPNISIEALFGPMRKFTTSAKLMDQGYISRLKIYVIELVYPDEVRHQCAKLANANEFKYEDEISFLVKHDARNKFLVNLANSRDHNTLLLFLRISHGKTLFEMLQRSKKKVYYIDGLTPIEERESIREAADVRDDIIIEASFGTLSVGVNIPNLQHAIFGHPAKGGIGVQQRIGRTLRKDGKINKAWVYDVVDNLTWKSYRNFSMRHFDHRLKIYNEQKYDIEVHQYTLPDV